MIPESELRGWFDLAYHVASDFAYFDREELEGVALEAACRNLDRIAVCETELHRTRLARKIMRWRVTDWLRSQKQPPMAPLPDLLSAPCEDESEFDAEAFILHAPFKSTLRRIMAGCTSAEIAAQDRVHPSAVAHRLRVVRRSKRKGG